MDIYGNHHRGEIYYIEKKYPSVGSEQGAGRPAIIVSNETGNRHSAIVEVVYLTTKHKKSLPTHVTVMSTGRRSTALCEQVHTVAIERIGSYCGSCTPEEMVKIDNALKISLALDDVDQEMEEIRAILSAPDEKEPINEELHRALIASNAQVTIISQMYKALIAKN